MAHLIAKIGLEVAGGQNRLSLDFCSRPSTGLPPWLPGVTRSDAEWTRAIARVEEGARVEDAEGWGEVVEEIASLSLRLGAREELVTKLRTGSARGRGGVLFVVTGQQPGAVGGTLLALYKVCTAVAIAAALEKMTQRPVVPLYWCGADDTDFEEIRALSLVTKRLTPISTAIAQKAHGPGMPVGAIAREWIDQVWKNIHPFVAEFENGSFLTQALESAFQAAKDHGEHAAAVLVRLAEGQVAVVDGRSRAVRRHGRSLILDYIRGEDEIKRAVADEGRRLVRAGYHAQVAPGDDSGVFLLENGVRKNVTRGMRQVLEEAARTDVGRCSPGVIARNLVQDAVFKPIAVVLGPAELAYRAQMRMLYDRFGIGVPVPVPRLGATFLPPAFADIVANRDVGAVADMIRDPGDFVRSIFDDALPGDLRSAAREMEGRVGEAADAYLRAVEEAAPPKAAGRVKARVTDLKNRSALAAASAAEIGKAIALERWPFLVELASIVKPAGRPQERILSALTPFLFGGAAASRDLHEVAAGYIDDLLDGRASHTVYSCGK